MLTCKKFIFCVIAMLLAMLLTVKSFSQDIPLKVPAGENILMDGRIGINEWNDSKKILITDSIVLYFKTSGNYVLIAVQGSKNFITDLYLTDKNNNLLSLHASAKLGQRTFFGSKWSDWAWWNNDNWAANVARPEAFDKPFFLTENVREYQIHRSVLNNYSSRIFLEVTFIEDNKVINTISYPKGALNASPEKWMSVRWVN